MTLPAVLSPEAEADLDDAATWHERQSDGLGKELVAEVRNALVRVGDQPEGYPELRSGVRRAQVRRFSYGIFYRVRAEQVEVIGVFHDRLSSGLAETRSRRLARMAEPPSGAARWLLLSKGTHLIKLKTPR